MEWAFKCEPLGKAIKCHQCSNLCVGILVLSETLKRSPKKMLALHLSKDGQEGCHVRETENQYFQEGKGLNHHHG